MLNYKKNATVSEQMTVAFLELLKQKPFIDISVSDVVRKAEVSRASFYRNFNSTSDILDFIVNEIANQFTKEILPALLSNDERLWKDFLFRFLYTVSDDSIIDSSSEPANISLIFTKISEKLRTYEQSSLTLSTQEKYKTAAIIGIITNISKVWINNGRKESSEEIVNTIIKYLKKF